MKAAKSTEDSASIHFDILSLTLQATSINKLIFRFTDREGGDTIPGNRLHYGDGDAR